MAFLEYKPNGRLYHYCGPDGFDGIVERGLIWLTDLQHANDPKELQLVSIIDELMLEISNNLNIDANLRATCKVLAHQLQAFRPDLALYSLSLSLKGDLLPMWQEYTDRGRGYCIAFRATAFNNMPLRIQKVRYVSPSVLASISNEIEKIVRPIVKLAIRPGQINLLSFEPINTIVRLFCLASSIKDDIWKYEQEIRLVFSSSPRLPSIKPPEPMKRWPIGLLPNGSFANAEEPLYRERSGRRVPYYEKPFGQWRTEKWDKSGSIVQVIVGYNNLQSVDQVSQKLHYLGYRNFDVVRSRCAFR